MGRILLWIFDAITSINFLEFIKTLAPVVTALIAFFALKNWQRQDKAKREAEFLDTLIEATHAYIVEMANPISVLRVVKIGMESHAQTWEQGEPEDIAVRGAIAYIDKYGVEHAKRLQEELAAARLASIKLRSLMAKGQIFNFHGYAKCLNAINLLLWHFDRLEALSSVVGSTTWNWENPMVRQHLRSMMAMDADEMRNSVQDNNVAFLEFARETYGRIYDLGIAQQAIHLGHRLIPKRLRKRG